MRLTNSSNNNQKVFKTWRSLLFANKLLEAKTELKQKLLPETGASNITSRASNLMT